MLWTIIIGGFAGWLAGQIFKGKSYGILINIIIGIVGGMIGGFVLSFLGFTAYSTIARIISAVIGAGILFWLIGVIRNN